MRLVPSAAILAMSLLLGACAGEARAPLALDERVVGAEEAPGSEPDPIETPVTASGLEELQAELDGLEVYEEDLQAIEAAGFRSMVRDTRFYPSEPDGEHAPGTRHVVTTVYEFDSGEGASAALEVAERIGLRPCAETCAYEISGFEPADMPDARGVQAIATQESIDRIGDDIQPNASYTVYFADGPFLYEVTTFGRPDDVEREQIEDIAAGLLERVRGAPPPAD